MDGTITFIQAEHREILSGLHKEIELLQRKCADLQLELSSRAISAKRQDDLERQLELYKSETVRQEETIQDLTTRLSQSKVNIEALEEKLRWKEVEFENEITSRDLKISELKKNLTVNSEIVRLQNECKRLYELSQANAQEKIDQVSDLARREKLEELTEKDKKISQETRKCLDDINDFVKSKSLDSQGFASMNSDRRTSIESRSKVFRHKLQKIYSMNIKDWSVDTPRGFQKTNTNDQSLFLYSFANPPSSLSQSHEFHRKTSSSSLPMTSSAATRFPPINPIHEGNPSQVICTTGIPTTFIKFSLKSMQNIDCYIPNTLTIFKCSTRFDNTVCTCQFKGNQAGNTVLQSSFKSLTEVLEILEMSMADSMASGFSVFQKNDDSER